MRPWYDLTNADDFDTPALVLFPSRIQENIQRLCASIDDINRLRPHVKTHKSPDVTLMLLSAGISRFKCATIAEAEMLAAAGARDILIAYPVLGPRITRLLKLIRMFPQVRWSCLCDHALNAAALSAAFATEPQPLGIFIDVNVGMNRTGIHPDQAPLLAQTLIQLPGLELRGLHAYDGHLRDKDFTLRTLKCDAGFQLVESLCAQLQPLVNHPLTIVAGGSPTFPIHARRPQIECSPGTFIYWDHGYASILPEQPYEPAALLICRVISKPAPGLVTVDLGHKAVAAENPLENRVHFLNADLTPVSQSEEHLVLREKSENSLRIGQVLFGLPYHVCPTVALYDKPLIAHHNQIVGYWETAARRRMITF